MGVRRCWRTWGQLAFQLGPMGHVALLFGPALARVLGEITAGV